ELSPRSRRRTADSPVRHLFLLHRSGLAIFIDIFVLPRAFSLPQTKGFAFWIANIAVITYNEFEFQIK
ncbi:unnamed protein product, partial [Callosobruchus maculatus]